MTSPTPNDPIEIDMRAPAGGATRLHLRAADVLEKVSDAFIALDQD